MSTGQYKSDHREDARPVDSFYLEESIAYAAIADDRDFAAQASLMAEIANASSRKNDMRSLELFAGPAFHSIALSNIYQSETYCVDSSAPMQDVAICNGNFSKDKYTVASLPCDLQSPFGGIDFHLIFAPRYSIGYINPEDLNQLYFYLNRVLHEEGVIIIEMHTPANIATKFGNLEIRERSAKCDNGTIYKCSWPHGHVEGLSPDGLVAMFVKLVIKKPLLPEYELIFKSEEVLYTEEKIKAAAAAASLDTVILENIPVFPGSILALHKKNNL